jgi:hypothetical protein
MTEAIKLEKDKYTFQKARIERLASELGLKVEFDDYLSASLDDMSVIKFRAARIGERFTATPTSGELRLSALADKPDAWLRDLLKELAKR